MICHCYVLANKNNQKTLIQKTACKMGGMLSNNIHTESWNLEESTLQINLLELKAINLALIKLIRI